MTENMATLRKQLADYKPPKLDPNLKRNLAHGWLIPYLLARISTVK